ncbi:MAG: S-layer homology domain-containing protein [Oscillospiraceae bacterium]|nr:S-layer homology domain-containing protein [Oscillospiraceae bacterium]
MLCICLVMVLILGTIPLTTLALETEPEAFRTEPMIVAGLSVYTVALRNDGTVWAWGFNERGSLGDGTTTNRHTPVQVQNLDNVTTIAAGGSHNVALRSDGTVWAWGLNDRGQLGDGTIGWDIMRTTPVQVQNLGDVTAIAAGGAHTLALKSDGTVWAWGLNGGGQLGDGTTTTSYTPVQVQNLDNVAAIAAGTDHTVALKNDGTVWAWGHNHFGQLGDGTTTNRRTPVQIQSLDNIADIAAGGRNTVALGNDGIVWAWGCNEEAQTGDGTRGGRRLAPVRVRNLDSATAIAAGQSHNVALRSDGTIWTWGGNQYGQLGDGTTVRRHTPSGGARLDNAVAIAAGAVHTVALRNDGMVWAWGHNELGQLGDGTGTNRTTPVQVLGPNGVGFLNLGAEEQQPPPPPPPLPFTDVPSTAWFHDAVSFVYANNIMRGASETTFDPLADFNREQVVATLFRMYHSRPANASDPAATPFADVDPEQWYAPYIAWAFGAGIVTGQTATTFGTGVPVTRQDFAVLVHRFANFTGADTGVPDGFTPQFPDAGTIGPWAEAAMAWAVYTGLITGTGEGLVLPWETANRAEAAMILMRYMQ